jgi:hypothetical protein
MKKLLYVIALLVVASYVLSSCTEEVVKPKGTQQGGSGVVE